MVFAQNTGLIEGNLDKFYRKAQLAFEQLSEEVKHSKPEELFCDGKLILSQLEKFTVAHLNQPTERFADMVSKAITFDTHPQPSFNKKFDLLIENFNEFSAKDFTNYIFCANDKQAQRFKDIFDDNDQEVHYETIVFPLYQGFVDLDQKIVCYTDHQIFERYHKFRLKNGYAKKQAITLQELNKLEVGDYVTHIDHGVGRFGGLQKIQVEGYNYKKPLKLIYGDSAMYYI